MHMHGVIGWEELLIKHSLVTGNIASHVFFENVREEQDCERQWSLLCCEMLLIERSAWGMWGRNGCMRVERITR